MNIKRLVSIAAAAALAGALFYFYGGHQAPDGQPPLAELTAENFESLRDAFNAAPDHARVILMFSPT